MNANGEFEIRSWEEETFLELEDGGKLTRASVTQAFTGDIAGEGAVQWLMCYRKDGTADFVGFQHLVGSIGDRSGSVVLQTSGTFDGREARGDWVIVPESGTDALVGIRGTGGFAAPLGSKASITLDYYFD